MMDAATLIAGSFRKAFHREPVVPVSVWADRYAVFRDVGGARVKWSTDRVPYMREIMDSTQVHGVTEITGKMCEQMAKTETLLRIIQSVVDQEPTRIQIIYPNDRVAKNQIKKKLLPAMRLTPRTLARLAGSRKNQDALTLEFDRTEIQTSGSNSPANVEGFAFGLSCIDELDRCEPDTEERVEGRGSALARSLRIKLSTPTLSEMGIDLSYSRSDRRRYHVPCPHCFRYDIRRLEDVRWPGMLKDGKFSQRSRDYTVSEHAAENEAYIICRHCDKAIRHDDNAWQLGLGVWVPEGCSIGSLCFSTGLDGAAARIPVVPSWEGTPGKPTHRGYELTGLYRCFPGGVNPYGKMAAGLVRFRGVPTAEWWNRRLGLAFSPKGESADEATLRAACIPVAQGGFRFGMAPNWAIASVAIADVQASTSWISVFALGPGDDSEGQRCALLWCEQVSCPPGLGLGPIDAALKKTWSRMDGTTIPLLGVGIDSGHRPDEVWNWGRGRGAHGRVVVRGVGGNSGRGGMAELIRWTTPERGPDGQVRPDSVKVLRVNTHAWKQAAVSMLNNAGPRRADSDSEMEPLGGTMRLFLPAGTPKEWIEQATSEQFATFRRNGSVTRQWVKKPGKDANHYFDTIQYFLAFCHAKGASGLRDRRAPGAPVARTPRIRPGAMFGADQ